MIRSKWTASVKWRLRALVSPRPRDNATVRGWADRAFEWLETAVEHNDPGLIEIVTQPEFVNLHEDPRWIAFLARIGKSPEQLAAIKFEVSLPT